VAAALTALGYLRDVVTRERLDFQFNPDDLPVEVSAAFASHSPRGATHVRRQYTHTSGRGGKISLVFIRQKVDAGDIEDYRRAIESLPYPDFDTGGRLRRGPHEQIIVFGGFRSLRVKITGVRLTQGPHFIAETTAPTELRAEITWEDAPEQGDLSRDDIRGGL
jgi:hypothetical protein